MSFQHFVPIVQLHVVITWHKCLFLQNTLLCRESSNGDGGSGDGGIDSTANLTPHQQHQQYLGDHRPELDQFPDLDWEGQVALGTTNQL